MKKVLTKVMLVALMAILPLSFYAQKNQTKPVEKYFYIFAEGGLSVNHTDLANYGFVPFYQDGAWILNDGYVFNNFDGQVGLGYQFGKVMGLNAKFGTATLAGEKHGQNLNFVDAVVDPTAANKGFQDAMLDKTTFMEANLNLTFNLSNLFFGYNPRRVFNFIPHLGVGGIRYHAGAVTSTTGATEPNIAAKADPEMTFTVPVGAELNFNLARKLDFFIDYTFTWAGNDRLDQVEKIPDDIQVINDMYSSVNAGLRFKFNKKHTCCDDVEDMCPAKVTMTTEPKQLEENNGKVSFDVVFEFPANYFEKEAVMFVNPTFSYKGGQIELGAVNFVGEKVNGGDYQVNYKNGGTFRKHYTIDFVPETGMENGKLIANPFVYVYDGVIYPNADEIAKNACAQCGDSQLANGIKYIAPIVPVIDTTPVVVEKPFENIGTVYFRYKSTTYEDNFKVNKQSDPNRKTVKSMNDYLANNPVKEVKILGYASPEGPVQLNQELSDGRSQVATDKLNFGDDVKVTVSAMGADWDGFYELLAQSDINDKDQIASVLKKIKDDEKRQQELKRMESLYSGLKPILDVLRRFEVLAK